MEAVQLLEAAKKRTTGVILTEPCKTIADLKAAVSSVQGLTESSDDMLSQIAPMITYARNQLLKSNVDDTQALKDYRALVSAYLPGMYRTAQDKFGYASLWSFLSGIGMQYVRDQKLWSLLITNGTYWQAVDPLKRFVAVYGTSKDDQELPGLARLILRAFSPFAGGAIPRVMAVAGISDPQTMWNTVNDYAAMIGGKATLAGEDAAKAMATDSQAGKELLGSLDLQPHFDGLTAAMKNIASNASGEEIKQYANLRLVNNISNFCTSNIVNGEGLNSDNMSSLLDIMQSIFVAIPADFDQTPETQKAVQAFYDEFNALKSKVSDSTKKAFDTLISSSSVTDEQATKWVQGISLPAKLKKMYQNSNGESEAEESLRNIFKLSGGSLGSLSAFEIKKGARANAQVGVGKVILSDDNKIDVLWHEVGHHIEFSNPNLLAKAKAFLRTRAGEDPGYKVMRVYKGRSEVAVVGGLSHEYIGRVYGDKTIDGTDATEIFSMALQMYHNEDYLLRSVLNNDGLLEFVLGALKGLSEGR